jgi:hypothetical protein
MAVSFDDIAREAGTACGRGDLMGAANILTRGYLACIRENHPVPDVLGAASLRLLMEHVQSGERVTRRMSAPDSPGVAPVLEKFVFERSEPGGEQLDGYEVLRVATERSRDVIGGYFLGREIPEMTAADAVLLGTVLENGGMTQRLDDILTRTNAAAEIAAAQLTESVDDSLQRDTLPDRSRKEAVISNGGRYDNTM